MKRTAIAALGAAMIATLGTSSVTRAAAINFDFAALNGSIDHDGTSLSTSTFLDLDDATELVLSAGPPTDDSGLNFGDTITLTGATTPPFTNAIIYGSAPGPLATDVVLTWAADPPGADMFTETLTTVTSIMITTNTGFINVVLTGTVSDTDQLFNNTPVTLNLTATQAGANLPSIAFSNSTQGVTPSIPEPSTWVMMALGFAALGYAAFRRRSSFGRMADDGTPSV